MVCSIGKSAIVAMAIGYSIANDIPLSQALRELGIQLIKVSEVIRVDVMIEDIEPHDIPISTERSSNGLNLIVKNYARQTKHYHIIGEDGSEYLLDTPEQVVIVVEKLIQDLPVIPPVRIMTGPDSAV